MFASSRQNTQALHRKQYCPSRCGCDERHNFSLFDIRSHSSIAENTALRRGTVEAKIEDDIQHDLVTLTAPQGEMG
jgi:hypothetical protein